MSVTNLRRIAVCVDDYGIHAPSDAAILNLAQTHKITAISVLVDGYDVRLNLQALRAICVDLTSCAVGLHLNLTERFHPALWCMPLKPLIVRSQCRLIDKAAIAQSIARQLDAFEALYQSPPDYVDGHEHAHTFPVVRALLLRELTRRYSTLPLLRVTTPLVWRGYKALIIAMLGGYGLKQQLQASDGFLTNRDFLGVYDFSIKQTYQERVNRWLNSAGDHALLMTHPGLHLDSVYGAAARRAELAYLQSSEWLAAVQAQGIKLVPFKRGAF
jgi:chitin disaccharide deacetylase